jgi:hypothetical protein
LGGRAGRLDLFAGVDVLRLVHRLARGHAIVHVGDVAADGVDPCLVDSAPVPAMSMPLQMELIGLLGGDGVGQDGELAV